MTFELFRIMSLVSSSDISMGFIFGLILNVMTTLVPMAIPVSIFFSTIFCLSRMSGDSEYVALRAAGLEKINIFKPFLIISILVAIVVYFFNQQLVPNAHRDVRKKIKIISSTSLIEGLKSGQFFTKLPNTTIFPTKVDEKTKEFKDIFLHIFEPKTSLNKVIVAKRGKILHEKNEKTGIESFKLYLEDGNIVNSSNGNDNLEKILFKQYTLPISEKRFSYKTSLKEIMMDKNELEKFIDDGFAAAEKRGFDKKEFMNAKYEFWQRLNTPVLCVLLTFLGFGLGVSSNRGKGKNSSSKAILILIGYYFIYFGLVSVSRDGSFPVQFAMIIPGFIVLGLSIKYYKGMDWLS
jgi:lipopolysaccharide export system permease protein